MKLILKVFSFDLISKVLVGLLGIVLIRFMAESEYALYIFFLAIINLIAQTIVITFRRIYILAIENKSKNYKDSNFLISQLIIVSFITPFVYFFSIKEISLYFILYAAVINIVTIEFLKTYFQKKMDFANFSKIEVWKSLLFFIFTVIGILTLKNNILARDVLLLQSLAFSLVFMWYFKKSKGIFSFKAYKENFEIIANVFFGPQRYLIYYVLLSGLLSQIDVLLLRYFSNDYELATYGSAFRYYTLVLLTLNAVNTIFLPLINKIENQKDVLNFKKTHTKVILLFVPLIFVGIWISGWILPIIDMGKYPEAVMIFRVLSFSVVLSLIFSPYATIVMKYGKYQFLLKTTFSGLMINIILNIIVIPQFGSVGVSFVTLATFGFINFLTYKRARKIVRDI